MTVDYDRDAYEIVARSKMDNYEFFDSIQNIEKIIIDMLQDISYVISDDINDDYRRKLGDILTSLLEIKYKVVSNEIILYKPYKRVNGGK